MNNETQFSSLLPLSYEDLKTRPIGEDNFFMTWGPADLAVFNYWRIKEARITIFLQIALDSTEIGLPVGDYVSFDYKGVSDSCVCAMKPKDRILRGDKPYLRCSSQMGNYQIDGPYFKENYPPGTDFSQMQMGYKIAVDFSWNGFKLVKKEEAQDNIVFDLDFGFMGSSIPMCVIEPESYKYTPQEIYWGYGFIGFESY